jgi:hypothetical protein
LPLLVLHHAPLLVQPCLRDGAEQVAHPVRLEEQREVEGVGRDVLEVVGPVVVGRPVDVRHAHLLQRAEVLIVVVLAPVEHQMLEQVREAGPARPLVLRSDVIPQVDRYDGSLVVLVDDESQAIGQHVALERDVDRRGALRLQRSNRHDGQRRGGGHQQKRGDAGKSNAHGGVLWLWLAGRGDRMER